MAARKKVVEKVAKGVKSRKLSKAVSQKKKSRAAKPKVIRRRPKVTAEEKLYLLFKEDYHARQIFEFLRVETVGELENYTAANIIDILSKPLQQTVARIRETLAEKFRHLAGDEAYLASYLEKHDPK